MRSVTSYFNPTLYRKNLARFWPLWGLYLFCGLCMTVLYMLQQHFYYVDTQYHHRWAMEYALELPQMLQFFVWVALFYAPLCAMAVYGYLYNHRSSCGIHAMPFSRDTLYVTNFLSGVSFFLVPNLVITLVTAITECALFLGDPNLSVALGRLVLVCLVLSGVELFFFGFASLCGMVTGNLLALPVFYGIFNGLVVGLYVLIRAWFDTIFYGYSFSGSLPGLVEIFTPVYKLMDSVEFIRHGMVGEDWTNLPLEQQYLDSPGTVAAYAVAGLVLAALGWLLYRKRHLESAGDVVAFHPLYPLFRVGVGVCAGLTGGTVMTAFFSTMGNVVLSTLFCLLWAAIGYFVAEMLLQKSFRVWKMWKGCAALLCACTVVSLVVQLDLLGIETRVPEVSEVEQVTIRISPACPDYQGTVTTDDPTYIAAAVAIHQTIVDNRERLEQRLPSGDYGWSDFAYVDVEYTLSSGTTLVREYNALPFHEQELADTSSLTYQLERLLQDPQFQRLAYGVDELNRNCLMTGAVLEYYRPEDDVWHSEDITEDLDVLWNAVKLDFQQGNLGDMTLFDPNRDPDYDNGRTTIRLNLSFVQSNPEQIQPGRSPGYRHMDCSVTSKAVHTIQALELLGVDLPNALKK